MNLASLVFVVYHHLVLSSRHDKTDAANFSFLQSTKLHTVFFFLEFKATCRTDS